MVATFGLVSTYPPTQCGLATFTASLRASLVANGDEAVVLRLVEAAADRPAPEVLAQLIAGDRASMQRGASLLNDCSVAILQHEYGIYGGVDGVEILDLLDMLVVPTIVVLHTVLVEPTPHQRYVLEAVASRASAVVTMTAAARDRLASGYTVDPAKVRIIAHGAPDLQLPTVGPAFKTDQVTILTWGLLGPGKGIRWAIEAMALLRDLDPTPRYVIAGQTHPKVLLHEGEAYREALQAQVRAAELGAMVSFDGRYRDARALASLIRSADIVLLPYDSTDQVTSGVLIEAVTAGKPVVATEFPHARELLAGGAGITVAHQDPVALAAALRTIITERGVAARMTAAAAATAPAFLWPAVAVQYRTLAAHLGSAAVPA